MRVCRKCAAVYTKELSLCGLCGQRLIEQPEDPLLGRMIDRYHVLGLIGSGGMARVYRARHKYLEQDYALKILHGEIAQVRSLAKRFQREAKAISKIKHPNVVAVADFGVSKEGLLFMAMELVEGRSLSHVVRHEGSFATPRAAQIVRQIALGLAAAHDKGFVHRDLKPANVMVALQDGLELPKILDFGLVRLMDPSAENTQLTSQGMFFGTPSYMSPEQVTGSEVGPQSDLYSLGVILYQLLTGSTPFSGDTARLAHQHVSSAPPMPPLAYGGLTGLALDLLKKTPMERPPGARAVVERIDAIGSLSIPPSHSPRPLAEEPKTAAELPSLAIPLAIEEPSSRLSEVMAADLRKQHQNRGLALVSVGLILAVVGAVVVHRKAAQEVGGDGPVITPVPDPPPAFSKVAPNLPGSEGVLGSSSPEEQELPEMPELPPPADAQRAAEPDIGTKTATDAVPSFAELDLALGFALSERGLSWADLAEREPLKARTWARWFRQTPPNGSEEVPEAFEILHASAIAIPVDHSLLEAKLRRVRQTLDQIPAKVKSERAGPVRARLEELTKRVGGEEEPNLLAAEISLLEGDAQVALVEAKKRAAQAKPTAPPAPLPEVPPPEVPAPAPPSEAPKPEQPESGDPLDQAVDKIEP